MHEKKQLFFKSYFGVHARNKMCVTTELYRNWLCLGECAKEGNPALDLVNKDLMNVFRHRGSIYIFDTLLACT